MPLISIIVPLYNSEKYLNKCIDSILTQTFSDFECILVDDGSTDSSSKICKEYELKDLRVKYYYQDNTGPAAARNCGVNLAQATMVMFVDSDDWLENYAIDVLYSKYEETKADMIVNVACFHIMDGKEKIVKAKTIYDNQSPLVYYFLSSSKGNCDKLMNKKLWDNQYIPEKSSIEDFVTGVQLFSKLTRDKIVCIDVPMYNYLRRKERNSLSYENPQKFNKPFHEIKRTEIFKWIETYISSLKVDDKIQLDAAYSWCLMVNLIIPYLLISKYITKKEINVFREHYKRSIIIGKYSTFQGIFISIFFQFIFLGKMIRFIYKIYNNIRRYKK